MEKDEIWAIGIFEGEGCISLQYPRDRKTPRSVLVVNMTDEDVVRRFYKAVEVGHFYGPKDNGPGRKPSWVWRCGKTKDVLFLLQKWLPMLGSRRTQAAKRVIREMS